MHTTAPPATSHEQAASAPTVSLRQPRRRAAFEGMSGSCDECVGGLGRLIARPLARRPCRSHPWSSSRGFRRSTAPEQQPRSTTRRCGDQPNATTRRDRPDNAGVRRGPWLKREGFGDVGGGFLAPSEENPPTNTTSSITTSSVTTRSRSARGAPAAGLSRRVVCRVLPSFSSREPCTRGDIPSSVRWAMTRPGGRRATTAASGWVRLVTTHTCVTGAGYPALVTDVWVVGVFGAAP